ncbi:MAG: plastocyanin/azurin family copper-binding protein [Halobacteriaceae archaeon]
MRRRRFLAAVGTSGAAAISGCAALGAAGIDYDVGMTAVAFDPAALTVTAGDEVVWYNNSSRGHTVTAYEDALPDGAEFFASGGYDSEAAAREAWRETIGGRLTHGDTFRHTFERPGVYEYFCIPHEQAGMVGQVEVTG